MNQRKPNIKAWYSLVLVMLLCIGLLAAATGTTLARYRAEREAEITFRVRPPEQIQLGTVEVTEEGDPPVSTEYFEAATRLKWVTENNVTQLSFAVANGSDEKTYSTRDQKVLIRMVGSVGLGSTPPTLILTLPPEEGETEAKTVTGTATALVEGTALHYTYGEGWLYTFLDTDGEELFWELPGGELSYIGLTVTIDGTVPDDPSLLQPYVVAQVIQE